MSTPAQRALAQVVLESRLRDLAPGLVADLASEEVGRGVVDAVVDDIERAEVTVRWPDDTTSTHTGKPPRAREKRE